MDKIITKKRTPRRIIKYSAIVFIFVSFILFIFLKSDKSVFVNKELIEISTVEIGPFQEFIPIFGKVQPKTTIYLGAIEGGRVEEIFVEAGSKVKKGDKILKLSNTNLLMTIINNEAQISRAINDLITAQLQRENDYNTLEQQRIETEYNFIKTKNRYERNKTLYKNELISKQMFEECEKEYEYLKKKRKVTIEYQKKYLNSSKKQISNRKNSLKSLLKNLNLVKNKLGNLTVRAPVSGLLSSLNVEIGETKLSGDRFGQIDIMDGFKVQAEINEYFINHIKVGLIGEYPYLNKKHKVTIKKIYPSVQENKFKVDLYFINDEPPDIKRGQTLHVELQLSGEKEAIMIERGTFYRDTGGNWIYVLNQNENKAVKRLIKLGRQNPLYFEVLEGLDVGEKVIISSYKQFENKKYILLK